MDKVRTLLDRLDEGMEEYHNSVEAMTDKELWDHCFSDNDIMETDFCVQELKKRFLYGNLETEEGANQYLLDEGYTQERIDEIGKNIKDKVLETMKALSNQPDAAQKE